MDSKTITAVGIDVSKGKSIVAIRRPGGEVVRMPFAVKHNLTELTKLSQTLVQVGGEIRIVMEHTGAYWHPIAKHLNEAGFFVSVVNAILIHDFSDNSLRKVKTDKADSLKIANYALTFWDTLRRYTPEDETRILLKTQSRLYERTVDTSVVLRNGLISLLDQAFPGANTFFTSSYRTASGHYKWVDFVKRFWHRDCVAGSSFRVFSAAYAKWCAKEGYHYSLSDADQIYQTAKEAVAILPKNNSTKTLIVQAVDTLNAVYDSLQIMREEMNRLASLLPEYDVVMNMYCVSPVTGPQLMAEIGDVRRFKNKAALVAFAGVDAPPYQSGTYDMKSRSISKRGSPHLRRTAFMVCTSVLQHSNPEDPVYAFMDRKRAEGKHYYVYMVAGAAKFLRIYYARVNEYLKALDTEQIIYN